MEKLSPKTNRYRATKRRTRTPLDPATVLALLTSGASVYVDLLTSQPASTDPTTWQVPTWEDYDTASLVPQVLATQGVQAQVRLFWPKQVQAGQIGQLWGVGISYAGYGVVVVASPARPAGRLFDDRSIPGPGAEPMITFKGQNGLPDPVGQYVAALLVSACYAGREDVYNQIAHALGGEKRFFSMILRRCRRCGHHQRTGLGPDRV